VGIILPRFEERVGKYAWILNSALWAVFHVAFGLGNIIILIPTLIVVPFVAQKTGNTWTAVILHSILSGPGFMAIAFGLIGR
jgi:membrane protease YdiL (CAAX protease family)